MRVWIAVSQVTCVLFIGKFHLPLQFIVRDFSREQWTDSVLNISAVTKKEI